MTHYNFVLSDPKELCNRIFVTCYMGTENSSEETRKRAEDLAKDIGNYFIVAASFFKGSSKNSRLKMIGVTLDFSFILGRTYKSIG